VKKNLPFALLRKMSRAVVGVLRGVGQTLDKFGRALEVAPFIEGCKYLPLPTSRHGRLYLSLPINSPLLSNAFLIYCNSPIKNYEYVRLTNIMYFLLSTADVCIFLLFACSL